MEFGWDPEFESFKREVRGFVEQWAPTLAGVTLGEEAGTSPAVQKINDELERRGWVKMAWPVEYGGQGKSPWYMMLLVEELNYGHIPATSLSIGSIAPAIANFGTEEQKQKYLPGIIDRTIDLCIGYSEPNAGTDLASLETRAVRDGDEWVINGQKIWTSNAQNATHIWLAARTDPEAPKHRGISMFIIPMDTPGISVRPIPMSAGGRTNETFFEDVRVPANTIIGDEGRGWYTVANALDHERVTIAPLGGLVRNYEDFIAYLASYRSDLLQDPNVRLRLAELNMEIHVQRALKTKNAAIIGNGATPNQEASMTKVWSSELQQRMGVMFMDLLGREGTQRRARQGEAPLGDIATAYISSPVLRFGGGTNEVQRNIIAQRGLGLPR